MVLEILRYPHPILRKKAKPVNKISKEVFELAEDMIHTMIEEDGLGLAANQIGSLLRIFIINTTPHEDKPKPIVMINPKILNAEGGKIEEEGCLSLPELYLKIPRAEQVRVYGKNLYNEDVIYELSGLMARAVQHEIDHLNGVLIIDHIETDSKIVKDYCRNLSGSQPKPTK